MGIGQESPSFDLSAVSSMRGGLRESGSVGGGSGVSALAQVRSFIVGTLCTRLPGRRMASHRPKDPARADRGCRFRSATSGAAMDASVTSGTGPAVAANAAAG